MTMQPQQLYLGVFIFLALAISGCTSSPVRLSDGPEPGNTQMVKVAEQMVGRPYRYGGTSPSGFDCSGLVQYSFRQSGQTVPRTTHAQYAQSSAVLPNRLQPGDLLFFLLRGKPSHVGIYVGDGSFVHAPSTGKKVGYGSLSNPYWRERLIKVGRF